ncbi:hypothetical protein [Pseudoalteromonas piscicida]|nr:hypothetical protein [Pseudoalteromonas piscicida]
MTGSGINHVRYDHSSRPTLLHLSCPKCNGRCLSRKQSESADKIIAGDCNTAWHTDDWMVLCESCTYRIHGLAYEELPPLYYQVSARGHNLWAWNKQHLLMLKKLINAKSIKDDPYEWFATYAHKSWIKKKNRAAFVNAINKFMANSA